jgi:hypothetical protein
LKNACILNLVVVIVVLVFVVVVIVVAIVDVVRHDIHHVEAGYHHGQEAERVETSTFVF